MSFLYSLFFVFLIYFLIDSLLPLQSYFFPPLFFLPLPLHAPFPLLNLHFFPFTPSFISVKRHLFSPCLRFFIYIFFTPPPTFPEPFFSDFYFLTRFVFPLPLSPSPLPPSPPLCTLPFLYSLPLPSPYSQHSPLNPPPIPLPLTNSLPYPVFPFLPP